MIDLSANKAILTNFICHGGHQQEVTPLCSEVTLHQLLEFTHQGLTVERTILHRSAFTGHFLWLAALLLYISDIMYTTGHS